MKDKIFFWMDAFLLHFCISYYLQKNHDADYYAIIDISNKAKKFFQEQDLVKLQKIWFYHDFIKKSKHEPDLNYLSSFEKKYEINLWKLAINERIFYRFNRLYKFSRNEILLILEQECKLYENIIDSIKPDFFIIYDPPLHNSKLLYELCRAKGVKTLGLYGARLGNKCIITEDGNNFGLKDLSGFKDKNRNFDELRKYKESFNVSKQLKNFVDGRKRSTTNQIKAANNFFLFADSKNIQTNYSYYGRNKINVLFDALKFALTTKYRALYMNKNLETTIDFKQNFVYFPLQPDEEINIIHYAPFSTNQVEIIRHIAKSIPIDYQLYVKEHPATSVRGWRSISEYKEMSEIPNVHLLHPSISHEKLLENCSLAITIRGTSGLSAAFYEKPAIVFGDVPDAALPSVQKVGSLEELPKLIQKSISTEVKSSDLDKYLLWLQENTIDFKNLDYDNEEKLYFYPGGLLVDVNIPIPKMKLFLEEKQDVLEDLAKEFLKKINKSNRINAKN